MPFDADKAQKQIESLTNLVGTLLPAVGAISGIIRLAGKAIRPSDARKAQEFDAAMAEVKQHHAALGGSLAEFDRIKAEIQSGAPAPAGAAPARTATSGPASSTSEVAGATTASASALVGNAPDASGEGKG